MPLRHSPLHTNFYIRSLMAQLGFSFLPPYTSPESCTSSRDLRKDALPAELRQPVVPVDHLGVLLSVLLEDELSLEAFVLVLASPPVLASLSLVLGHLEESLGWLSLNQKRHKKT